MGQPKDDLLHKQPATLDPADWTAFRSQARHMLDDMREDTQTDLSRGFAALKIWFSPPSPEPLPSSPTPAPPSSTRPPPSSAPVAAPSPNASHTSPASAPPKPSSSPEPSSSPPVPAPS